MENDILTLRDAIIFFFFFLSFQRLSSRSRKCETSTKSFSPFFVIENYYQSTSNTFLVVDYLTDKETLPANESCAESWEKKIPVNVSRRYFAVWGKRDSADGRRHCMQSDAPAAACDAYIFYKTFFSSCIHASRNPLHTYTYIRKTRLKIVGSSACYYTARKQKYSADKYSCGGEGYSYGRIFSPNFKVPREFESRTHSLSLRSGAKLPRAQSEKPGDRLRVNDVLLMALPWIYISRNSAREFSRGRGEQFSGSESFSAPRDKRETSARRISRKRSEKKGENVERIHG